MFLQIRKIIRVFIFSGLVISGSIVSYAQPYREHQGHSELSVLSGRVVSADSTAVDFATVYLKGTSIGCATNEKGIYYLKAPAGNYTLVVSAIGFETHERNIRLERKERNKHSVVLRHSVTRLGEAVVTGGGVSRLRNSPFNAVVLDTKQLQNSTKSLSEALSQLPGVKVRQSGGMGSDMQLMLDGFGGKHVRVFIDGMPQEGAGVAFGLNNIPVNFAERIEVYKGVVPVEFGTDAIGGIINVVTNKQKRNWFLDASYAYGSFHTHQSYVHFGQTLQKGFMYEINVFRNYSDNDYHIDNWVRKFEVQPDGSVIKLPVDKNDVRHVRRFHDAFHNEVITGKLGFVSKKWADRLVFSFSYARFYKEIQTGVYQEIVFGQKHRKGHSFVPSLEYRKQDLLIKGLGLAITVNYNRNLTYNVDTAARYYNWFGEYYIRDIRGEQSYQNSELKNTNRNATLNLNYRISSRQALTFHYVYSDFRRTSRSYIGTSSVLTDFDIPKITRKHVSGLSYRLIPSDKWNVSAFVKHYHQYNRGPVSQSADGVGDYVNREAMVSTWGYGAAATWYIFREWQAKFSYEKAFRLPSTDELFGDEDLEAGRADLKPEKSDNFNFNLTYHLPAGKHDIYLEGSLIYRNTKDYIKRGLGKHGTTQYGIYENHGHVKTKGYNVSVRYAFARWFSIGATYNHIDTRDYEKLWTGGSGQMSMHYKVRLPNIPYRYANADMNFFWHDLFAEGTTLSLTYDGFWQHEFPLNWENIGEKSSKAYVPDQLSHNVSLSYSLRKGRYNFSLECRNLTDEPLYDNFSLQKPGRAFSVKARVHFGH